MEGPDMETYGTHQYPGRLFVVEGVDGSGKSTQIALLRQWLISEGYTVFFSEWNSSPLVKKGEKEAVANAYNVLHDSLHRFRGPYRA
jgi:thymidylate kinase